MCTVCMVNEGELTNSTFLTEMTEQSRSFGGRKS